MTDISYESLVEKSLLNVVSEALKIAEQEGLGDTNHFYISFRTQHPGIIISDRLKASYPDEMTIVLQHEFTALEVTDTAFSVTLSFGNIPERITVPFQSITRFADPYAQFALSFMQMPIEEIKEDKPTKALKESKRSTKKEHKSDSKNVVSLSAFRNKK